MVFALSREKFKFSSMQLLFAVDGNQFHFENQCGMRTNFLSRSASAISKIRGDEEFILIADSHELQCFGPAFDDSTYTKINRFSSINGTIENRSIE